MSTFESKYINENSPFPDGQPHVTIDHMLCAHDNEITLSCRINSPLDLFKVAQVIDTLRHNEVKSIDLMIWHLMGARMDRRLSDSEPYTLRVICDIINSFECDSVSVFCPHSQATSDLLNNYVEFNSGAEAAFFDTCILKFLQVNASEIAKYGRLSSEVRNLCRQEEVSLVFPDAGGIKRFNKSPLLGWWPKASLVIMYKERDERTSTIITTKLLSGTVNKNCIIIDDLCDGGRTFTECAKVLEANGAEKIGLSVAHGIFSKGLPLEGIDFVSCSNSYSTIDDGSFNFEQVRVW